MGSPAERRSRESPGSVCSRLAGIPSHSPSGDGKSSASSSAWSRRARASSAATCSLEPGSGSPWRTRYTDSPAAYAAPAASTSPAPATAATPPSTFHHSEAVGAPAAAVVAAPPPPASPPAPELGPGLPPRGLPAASHRGCEARAARRRSSSGAGPAPRPRGPRPGPLRSIAEEVAAPPCRSRSAAARWLATRLEAPGRHSWNPSLGD